MKFTNVSLLTVVASIVLLAGCTTTDNGQNTKLAECLTSKGVMMYGTNRCSHCQNQKELFGYDAFTKINFVDCDKEKNTCALAGVQGYPTWAFADGSKLEGTQTFESLASQAGCNLDGSSASVISTGTTEETTTTGDVMTWDTELMSGTQEMVSGSTSTGN